MPAKTSSGKRSSQPLTPRGRARGNPRAAQRRGADGCDDSERAFIRAYIETRDLSEGAKAAGSKGKDKASLKTQGYRIRHRPHVAKEIARLDAALSEQAVATKLDVLHGMRQSIDDASRAGQHSAAIRAWELLGKDLGLFTDKLDVRVQTGVQNVLEAARPFMRHPETFHDVVQAIAQAAGLGGLDQAAALPVGEGAAGERGPDQGAGGSDETRH